MENKDHYQQMIQRSPFGYAYHQIILDNAGKPCDYRFLEVNNAFVQISGRSAEQLTGMTVSQVFTGIANDGFDWISLYNKIAFANGENNFDYYLGGVDRWYKVSVVFNGELYFTAILTDIAPSDENLLQASETWNRIYNVRMQTARKLKESEEKHRSLILQMQEGLVVDDEKGNIRFVNPMFCKMTGFEEHELVGKSGYQLMLTHENIVKMFKKDENRRQNLSEDYELEITAKNGVQKTLWFHATPVLDSKGSFIGSMSTVIDITERKQLENELNQQTHLRELLMEISSGFINIPFEQVDLSIEEALKKMALFVGADRSYTFDYDWENDTCNNTFEWCAEGITPEIGNLQEVPLSMMQDWVEAHRKGEPMYVPDVFELPRGAVREILEPQDIKSVLAVPMINDGKCIGFVGFDSVRKHHNYSVTEQQLLKLFAQSLANVRKRKDMMQELIASKENAEESDHLKTAFLQNLSHEIRTPLNGIIGFSDLLRDPGISTEEREYFTGIVIERGWQLTAIIDDILTVSSLETKQEQLYDEAFNLNTLLKKHLAIFAGQASAKGIQLMLNTGLSELEADILADKTKLGQILNNLLTNAIKFTLTGEIELGCRFSGDNIEFHVKDTGSGIDKAKQQLIFGRFTQADESIRRIYGGTGLGLSICKGFVELMGGTIWVESEPGHGSVFSFTLPYHPSVRS